MKSLRDFFDLMIARSAAIIKEYSEAQPKSFVQNSSLLPPHSSLHSIVSIPTFWGLRPHFS